MSKAQSAKSTKAAAPTLGALTVEYWPIAKPIPYARNARKIPQSAIDKVAASIQEFGFRQPIVVDTNRVILAGHTRLLAAQKLELKEVPVHVAKNLTVAQAKAYRLADNRTNEEAVWDNELLALELADLQVDEFDLELTAFNADELSELLSEKTAGLTDEDAVPEVPQNPVTQPGDLWILGNHRLLCGDSTKCEDVERLMNGHRADMVFTDPPYGISAVKGGHVGGSKPFGSTGNAGGSHGFGGKKGGVHGLAKKAIIATNLYAPIIGDETTDTAIATYNLCAGLAIPVLIFWGGNYYADKLPPSRCWIVWDKEVNGSFADVELAWTNIDHVARLFRHQWSGLMKASERGERRCHPTQKPVALANWCFEEFGENAKSVLDLFLGSGSTLIACEKTSRACYGMEMSADYCDVIVKRWQDFTGKEAHHENGRTFDALEASRTAKKAA